MPGRTFVDDEKPQALIRGCLAVAALLAIYFGVVTVVSGWDFAKDQFERTGYYVVSLAIGFGIQVGLYSHLKCLTKPGGSSKVVVATGGTSTAAMISCCAHYLANLLPILGLSGVAMVISQYQIELFWVGLAFNAAGIIYLTRKILVATRQI